MPGVSTSTLISSIQAQITALDTQLASISPTSVGADGVSVTNNDWVSLSNQRLKLEMILGRLTGDRPMIVRGRVKGIGHGRY